MLNIFKAKPKAKKQNDQPVEFEKNDKKYQLLFDKMMNGFAYHRIVLNKAGKPIDYVFLEVNKAFEDMTGLKASKILGKRVTAVLPGIKKDPADWIGKYGQTALDGKEVRLEQYAEPLGKWFSVLAFSPQKGYFAAIIEDVTERKKAVEDLSDKVKQLEKLNKVMVDRELKMVELKDQINKKK